jgi:hypothetical protein
MKEEIRSKLRQIYELLAEELPVWWLVASLAGIVQRQAWVAAQQ